MNRRRSALVLAADTVVAVANTRFGKANTEPEAREMRRQLIAAQTHTVITAIAIRCPARDIDLTTSRKEDQQ